MSNGATGIEGASRPKTRHRPHRTGAGIDTGSARCGGANLATRFAEHWSECRVAKYYRRNANCKTGSRGLGAQLPAVSSAGRRKHDEFHVKMFCHNTLAQLI